MTAGAKTEAPARNSAPKSTVDRKEQKRLEAEQRQARSGKLKGQKQLVHQLEKQIQDLEKRQAAITAELAKGASLVAAVASAKRFITEAIRTHPRLGLGSGPLNHFA